MYDIRKELGEEVRSFLVGPRSDDEILPTDNPPADMYVSGILFPRGAIDESENDDDSDSSRPSDFSTEQSESKKILRQNSIGMSMIVSKEAKSLRISVNYGKYSPTSKGWERYELEESDRIHEINLDESKGSIEIKDGAGDAEAVISWSHFENGALNLFLENPREWIEGGKEWQKNMEINNSNTIFQPSLEIVSNQGVFGSMESSNGLTTKEDELFKLIYSDKKIFASGYGCAAEWNDKESPSSIKSAIIPTYMEPNIAKFADSKLDPTHPSKIDMYELGCFDDELDQLEKSRDKIISIMKPMVEKYSNWIESQRQKADYEVPNELRDLAMDNVKKCEKVLDRMKEGISIIGDAKNDKILKAFVIANRAMLYQRIRFLYALKRFKGRNEKEPIPEAGKVFWHPFQIAFLLMSLTWIRDKTHLDNMEADLIWFPTGGGKTEAYLGVAATVMAYRRLAGNSVDGLGVSVIMRYTLRLLTLQQFERASALICALEFIRRKDAKSSLGEKPFLIGLWVGQSLTPNMYEQSKDALEKLGGNWNTDLPEGSPWQTNYCPWCGHRINPNNYKFDKNTKWTILRCTNDSSTCIFTDRNFNPDKCLPMVTVDSDIYTRCPSMIIATVDKFARIAFRPETANIFGRARRRCTVHGFLPKAKYASCNIGNTGSHRGGKGTVNSISETDSFPPDLIIQDELHLISGPLGSLVGLYESAIDYVTRKKINSTEVRPKIIASTATIKGGGEQIRRIYDRNSTNIFPPPGISRKDSFFWWEDGTEGRMFCGMSFSNRSAKYSLARIYGALLQRIQILKESGEDIKKLDYYWTLVGYFNSIRELGGANRLVEDDVIKNINFISHQIYSDKFPSRDPGVQEHGIDELTSRKNQREINEIRDKLERSLPDENVMNILLATNMISVGIDIDRLSLMVINGQPKTTTEYIQAAGRIGRRAEHPGAVFSFYNPYKPRDLSHYENFVGYHETIQKYVEPTIVTPFSVSCYKRAVHAVMISMIRLTNEFLSEREQANDFEIDDAKDPIIFLKKRFQNIEQVDEDSESLKEFESYIREISEDWSRFIKQTETMRHNSPNMKPVWYNNSPSKWNRNPPNENILMIEFANQGKRTKVFPISTPESLRDVEQQLQMEYYD